MNSGALSANGQNRKSDFEILGEWQTTNGNRLMLKARSKTGYASIWLDHNGHPVKIGYTLHAGGVLRDLRWEAPWREQTQAWKTQQRNHIAALIAAWHADNHRPPKPSPLPSNIFGVFDLDGFRFAVEPTATREHAVLSVINNENGLTPVADLLHDDGRLCGLVTRPGWKGTPDDRKRRWRTESQTILTRAATENRL
ncbi:hypothetical protein [Glycomyces sp. MUSA5-2]|uniref:hypothetical protein n=1 Tax=Glycomyces sp. MUSA5-2 TaxID=2053002 RepID=UPI003008263A